MDQIKKQPPPRLFQQKSLNFTHSDGSRTRVIGVRELIRTDIWNGNRILDEGHRNKIQEECINIKDLDKKPFVMVSFPSGNVEEGIIEKWVIIDGQHRVSILRDHFRQNQSEEDFDVLVTEKAFDTEHAVFDYFKILNNVKRVEYKEDPRMIANTYINSLTKVFEKNSVIREDTKRPYLRVSKLRDTLCSLLEKVQKDGAVFKTSEEFALAAEEINRKILEILKTKISRSKMEDRAILLEFALGLEDKLGWVSSCLSH